LSSEYRVVSTEYLVEIKKGNRKVKKNKTAYIIFCLLFAIFMLSACTNWKALYVETQHELEECQSAQEEEIIVEEPKTITFDGQQVDTIYIPYKPVIASDKDTKQSFEKKEMPRHDNKPEYQRRLRFSKEQDSVVVFLTIMNQLQGNRFVQAVQVDSVLYNKKVKTITKTVPIQLEAEYNYYRDMFVGIAAALLVLALFAFIKHYRKG